MRNKKIFISILLCAFAFSFVSVFPAEEKDKTFSGNFLFGYRMVGQSGAAYKYKEDINLDDGLRLFSFSLQYVPQDNAKKLFDRLDMNLYNFGGDPFETFGLSVHKNGKYRFQYDRKKSAYFYYDLHKVGGGLLYDYHSFDFERVSDSGFLKVWLGDEGHFYLNFDKFSRKGESITTLDINRIEFEFDKPMSEESKELTVGLDFHMKRLSIVLEEKIQDYENSNSFFLPGYTDGGPNARYPSSLNYFYMNQPYDFKSNTHTLKFNARPLDSLLISGSARLSNLDMNLAYSEEADGVTYLGRLFNTSMSGEGNFDREMKLYDLDITYMMFKKLALVGAVRYHTFDQDGSLTIDGEKESLALAFDTLGFEGGLQYQFSPKFVLTFGYRNETRELEGIETATYEEKTKREGFFGNFKWDLARSFKLTADYQRSTYDEPFTLVSPTGYDRLRITARLSLNQFHISGSYLLKTSKSEVFEDLWESTRNQFTMRAGYHAGKLSFSAGYALIDVEHKGDRTIAYPPSWTGPSGTFLREILYEGKSGLFDASLSFQLREAIKIGGYVNSYVNKGFWQISRTTFKGYLEYLFQKGFIAQLGYRFVDFKEKDSGLNDYKANIVEVSFGYRWE